MKNSTPSPHLNKELTREQPALDKDIPEEWKKVENVSALVAGKLPWSPKGYMFTPFASQNDSYIDLCIFNNGINKTSLPKVLKAAEKVFFFFFFFLKKIPIQKKIKTQIK